MLLAGTDSGLVERHAGSGYPGKRQCTDSSEDVREPSFFVDKLIDMGAQIILCDPHRAVVIGHNHGFTLRGGNMTSPDIRAGIALLYCGYERRRYQPDS